MQGGFRRLNYLSSAGGFRRLNYLSSVRHIRPVLCPAVEIVGSAPAFRIVRTQPAAVRLESSAALGIVTGNRKSVSRVRNAGSLAGGPPADKRLDITVDKHPSAGRVGLAQPVIVGHLVKAFGISTGEAAQVTVPGSSRDDKIPAARGRQGGRGIGRGDNLAPVGAVAHLDGFVGAIPAQRLPRRRRRPDWCCR